MIYKYTKCESVIAKIMADANMSDKDLRVTDIREWIFEAVEKIGAPMQYIMRESGEDGCPIFHVCDGHVEIPDDLESLIAVAYSPGPNGPWVAVRKNELTFKGRPHHIHKHAHMVNVGPMYDEANMVIEDRPVYEPVVEYQEGKYSYIPEQPMRYKWPVTKSQLYTEFNRSHKPPRLDSDVTYFLKPGWIVLNRMHGHVKLVYKSIATDERGYPLIPDLASYQEAIYWYVMMKLSFPKFLTGSLGGRAKYNFNTYSYILLQWNFYRNQAYAEAMMPNEGEMMSIKNEWNKLIPDFEDDNHNFFSNGREQTLYNDYYYGY